MQKPFANIVTLVAAFLTVAVVPPRVCGQIDESKPLEFAGRLEARQSVDLRPRVSGIVTKVNFRAGDLVKQGEVLFEIESKTYELTLARAESELKLAEARKQLAHEKYEIAKPLALKGTISREESSQLAIQAMEAEQLLNVARINVTAAKLDLEFTKIRSPIDGLIGKERVTPGNLVRPDNTSLAEVVEMTSLHAVFEMDEKTLLAIRRANQANTTKTKKYEVTVRLADGVEYSRKGQVDFVDNRVNPETGTIRVGATIPNPERLLLPGMYVRVVLRLDRTESNKK